MTKWECPTQEDMEIIKSTGLDPSHCAVAKPGENQLVILNWRNHSIENREIYVRLPEKRKNTKRLGN